MANSSSIPDHLGRAIWPVQSTIKMPGTSIARHKVYRAVLAKARSGSCPGSHILLGRAKWSSMRHAKLGLAQARHGTTRPEEPSQQAVLGPPLHPVGRHGPAHEAGGPLRHDERHDPLVARPIKGMTHPAWSIIVVMYQVLLWSCISIIMVMYQVFKYYGHHILLVQKFL
jgi:hypothetical protein